MFHTEISLCAEGETGNGRRRAEETLVVTVVGYAVCAGSVVVYQAEVVGCLCALFRGPAELVEAGRYGTRLAGAIAMGRNGSFGGGVYQGAVCGEEGGGVDAEDGGIAGGVNFCFDSAALDFVFYSVEEEGGAEEVEERG